MGNPPLPLNPPVPQPTQSPAPPAPDVAAPTPAPPPPGATPATTGPGAPAPAAPKRETFRQGFGRGGGGDQYVTDAQGHIINARTTRPSMKGTFGAILAGATIGALQGATAARPRGRGDEGGGGFGPGAAAAQKYIQQRDQANRDKAQQNFENQNKAQEVSDTHLEARARVQIDNLQALNLEHEIARADRDDPEKAEILRNQALDSKLTVEKHLSDLGYTNPRTYGDYNVPQSEIDKFNQQKVKIVPNGDHTVTVYDRTVNPASTPNAADFEIRELHWNSDTHKPEWKTVATVKAGQGTVGQLQAELQEENKESLDAVHTDAQTQAEMAQRNLRNRTTPKGGVASPGNNPPANNPPGNNAPANNQNAEVSHQTTPGAPDEAYIQSLPSQYQSEIRELGNGQISLSRWDYLVSRAKTKDGTDLMALVTRAYPGFNAAKISSYNKAYIDYTSGKTYRQLNSGATVFQHLKELSDLNTDAARVNIGVGSASYRTAANRRYDDQLETVVSELSQFYGVGSTEGNRDHLRNELALGANTEAAIKQQALAMGDKFDTFHSDWIQAAPSDYFASRMPSDLDDKQKLARHALDPNYKIWDAAAYLKANPNGNVYAAITQAEREGSGVINAPRQ